MRGDDQHGQRQLMRRWPWALGPERAAAAGLMALRLRSARHSPVFIFVPCSLSLPFAAAAAGSVSGPSGAGCLRLEKVLIKGRAPLAEPSDAEIASANRNRIRIRRRGAIGTHTITSASAREQDNERQQSSVAAHSIPPHASRGHSHKRTARAAPPRKPNDRQRGKNQSAAVFCFCVSDESGAR